MINCPPGWGKSELCKHFVAWAMAHYPDSKFLYVSHGHELASEHTHGIKQIMELPHYKKLFGIEIVHDSSAKDNFKTNFGGSVKAFGSKGPITGQDAGFPGTNRFTGCIMIDDIHKPDEVFSDTIRESIIKNYSATLLQRLRGPTVPIIFIGQRLHEEDLPGKLKEGLDGNEWHVCTIKALNDLGQAVYPEFHPLDMLRRRQETDPYVFASQFQQDPIPAGGGIFKPEWFYLMDNEPGLLQTFITVDSAETDKTYNDATVFSFWGIYKITDHTVESGMYGLHCIDCYELRVEPKDLEPEFSSFYMGCMQHKIKPSLIAIEKKSTGVTLLSVLGSYRGLRVIDIERTKASGNKTARFLEIQPYVARKLVSLPRYGKHTPIFLEHMRKITANNTHRFDDIADTLYDAVKLSLIDKVITGNLDGNVKDDEKAQMLMASFRRVHNLQGSRYGSNR